MISRGEIYYADLGRVMGSEQGGTRPVLVVQNDIGNKFSPTIQIAPITSKSKSNMKTHVVVDSEESGLPKNSTILMEQIRTIDRSRLRDRIGKLDLNKIGDKLNMAIMVSFGIPFLKLL